MLWLNEPMAAVRELLKTLPPEKQSPTETPNAFIVVPPGYGPLVRRALRPPLRASFANAEAMKFADFRPMTSGVELRWYRGPDRRSGYSYSLVNVTFGVGTFTESALYKELTEWAIISEGRAEYERRKREVQSWGMAYPEAVSKNNNFELTVRLRLDDDATAEQVPVIAPQPRA
jgi:hypothetical protein